MRHRLIILVTVCAALLGARADAQTTVGLHAASHHWPARDYSNINPGAYVRTTEGWTAGFYRNSLRRVSVYAGRTFSTQLGVVEASITLGAISGYDRRVPLLAVPSVAVPVGAARVRLAVVPRAEKEGAAVLHLSVERSFTGD